MKKVFILLFFISVAATSYAQRIAIIDSKAILDKVPEYQKAQSQLDKYSQGWETEIKQAFEKVEQMYKTYQAEASMLDASMKKNREDEIMKNEKEAKELQKKYFGYEGELYKKRESLVKPIQDKIYNAVQQIATKEGFDIILDKATGTTIFYNNSALDINAKVLKALGIN